MDPLAHREYVLPSGGEVRSVVRVRAHARGVDRASPKDGARPASPVGMTGVHRSGLVDYNLPAGQT